MASYTVRLMLCTWAVARFTAKTTESRSFSTRPRWCPRQGRGSASLCSTATASTPPAPQRSADDHSDGESPLLRDPPLPCVPEVTVRLWAAHQHVGPPLVQWAEARPLHGQLPAALSQVARQEAVQTLRTLPSDPRVRPTADPRRRRRACHGRPWLPCRFRHIRLCHRLHRAVA